MKGAVQRYRMGIRSEVVCNCWEQKIERVVLHHRHAPTPWSCRVDMTSRTSASYHLPLFRSEPRFSVASSLRSRQERKLCACNERKWDFEKPIL